MLMKKLIRVLFSLLVCAAVASLALWWWNHRDGRPSADQSGGSLVVDDTRPGNGSGNPAHSKQRHQYTLADIPANTTPNDRVVFQMAIALSDKSQTHPSRP